MNRWVEIQFECLPLRSVATWETADDMSPKFRDFCERVAAALRQHGVHNTYFLHNARCAFHLTNDPDVGMLEFLVEGVVLTDAEDRRTQGSDLTVLLTRETCSWLTQQVVRWFEESVQHAVRVEFDRYIEAGDLEKTRQRIARLQAENERLEGFLGMYL